MYKYDIALSYASEQKSYVAGVCKLLKLKGLSVYFAADHQEELVGADMTKEFYTIFHDQCFLIAAFVSEEYLQKKRPMDEASIGQMRSREENRNCLIPVYFGSARLPDFDPDINYLSARKPEAEVAHYLAEVVRLQKEKLNLVPAHKSSGEYEGAAPRVNSTIHISGNNIQIVQADTITGSNIQCAGDKDR